MDAGALRAYVDRSRELLESSAKLSERNTQLRLVQPFLTALDWELHQISADHRVRTADGTVTVDFALLVDGEPAVIVETTACAADLERERAERLGRILLRSDVDRGIHTNGRGFAFLAADGGELDRFECRLEELPANPDAVGHYARDAVERRLTDARRRRREAAESLAAERDAVVADVSDRLVAAAGDEIAARLRAETGQFVDGLIESLRDEDEPEATANDAFDALKDELLDDEAEASFDGETERSAAAEAETSLDDDPTDVLAAGAASESTVDANASGTDGDRDGVDRDDGDDAPGTAARATRAAVADDALGAAVADGGQYVVRFFGGRTSVWAVGHARAAMTTAQAIEYLLRRGEAERLSAPWGPDGRRAVLLEDAVEDATIELSNGWHLDARVSVDTARDAIEELADRAGLRAMFQDEWSDRD